MPVFFFQIQEVKEQQKPQAIAGYSVLWTLYSLVEFSSAEKTTIYASMSDRYTIWPWHCMSLCITSYLVISYCIKLHYHVCFRFIPQTILWSSEFPGLHALRQAVVHPRLHAATVSGHDQEQVITESTSHRQKVVYEGSLKLQVVLKKAILFLIFCIDDGL